MANKILTTFETPLSPACTLKGVLNSSGRISSMVDNSTYRAERALVSVLLTAATSAAPTANTAVKVYMVRNNNSTAPIIDGALGTTDAGIGSDPTDAEQLGAIVFGAVAGEVRQRNFLAYDLPPQFGIAFWNQTGQPLGTASSSQHDLQVTLMEPEVQ